MWNNIIFDFNYSPNYNLSFPNSHNDIITHLTHWQYWWWFWFTFLLTLYYVIVIKFITSRSLKFNPKIVTSYRSHGKWGDMIICILPISWCLNILSNSTTLLKILEWQSEANYFTIRVRGKQWYWVYKFDMKSVMSNLGSSNVLKKIGNQTNHVKNLIDMDYTYYSFVYNYWSQQYLDKILDDTLPDQYIEEPNISTNFKIKSVTPIMYKPKNNYFFAETHINNTKTLFYEYPLSKNSLLESNKINKKYLRHSHAEDFALQNYVTCKNNNFFFEPTISRWWRESLHKVNELKLQKIPAEMIYTNNNLMQFKYLEKNLKKFSGNYYSVVKQKSKIDWHQSSYDFDCRQIINIPTRKNELSMANSVNVLDPKQIQLFNNMRLLKINTILVLPSNIHINAITNSFDVIHSWFLPGLGLKMDCVPGRSTHHTLYIDNPGMYYGQCAEICGRFHHHMPIRICAMLYEHYFLWWYHVFSKLIIADDIETQKPKFVSRINMFVK